MSKKIAQSFSCATVFSISALLFTLGEQWLAPSSGHQPANLTLSHQVRIFQDRLEPAASTPALIFEANKGQADARVKFVSRSNDYTLFLLEGSALFSLSAQPGGSSGHSGSKQVSVVEMQLLGSSADADIRGIDRLASQGHYFKGNIPSRWYTHIPHFGGVEYKNVYPGIDLKYYQKDMHLEYDFIVAPYADPGDIQFAFSGAESLTLDESGNLIIRTAAGDLIQHAPYVYQEAKGRKQTVASTYQLDHNSVSFRLASYDRSRPLVIDPGLVYSSYLGGSQADEAHAIAVDDVGNFYVTGWTQSTDFPDINGLFSKAGGSSDRDAFVAKFDRDGQLVFVAYLGGSGSLGDAGHGIAVDANGKIYVTGETDLSLSNPFPTTSGAFSSVHSGNLDAFVSILGNDGGSLLYSTLLGGGLGDIGEAVAVDSLGNVYVAGTTFSESTTPGDGFPVMNAFQSGSDGAPVFTDAFVFKLSPNGNGASDLVYSTYLSGSGTDKAHDITVDSSGNAYVIGDTNSADFPVVMPLQVSLAGAMDAFVVKFGPAGGAPIYATYLGGAGTETGMTLAVDSSGAVFLGGQTGSSNFPVANTNHSALNGASDAYLSMLDPAGNTLSYSAYLGGSSDEEATGIAVDNAGDVMLAGYTGSADFPLVNSVASYSGGASDIFLTKVDIGSDTYRLSLLHGGSLTDQARDLAIAPSGVSAYMTGWTRSSDFTLSANAHQQISAGGLSDAFVFKAGDLADLSVTINDSNVALGATVNYTVIVDNQGPDVATGVILAVTLPVGVIFDSADPGCVQDNAIVTCDLAAIMAGAFVSITISAIVESASEITTLASVSANENDLISANNADTVVTLAGPASTNGMPINISDGAPADAAAGSNKGGGGALQVLGIFLLGAGLFRFSTRRHAA